MSVYRSLNYVGRGPDGIDKILEMLAGNHLAALDVYITSDLDVFTAPADKGKEARVPAKYNYVGGYSWSIDGDRLFEDMFLALVD